MDFEQVIWGKKTFADLLKEIYDNSKTKEKQISELVKDLKPMIKEPGDAMLLVPLLKEYLDLGIKNDEHLIKMAMIVQRAMQAGGKDVKGEVGLSEEEKNQLFGEIHKIKDVQKN